MLVWKVSGRDQSSVEDDWSILFDWATEVYASKLCYETRGSSHKTLKHQLIDLSNDQRYVCRRPGDQKIGVIGESLFG